MLRSLIVGMLTAAVASNEFTAAQEKRISSQSLLADNFVKIHHMIKPQPGELRFHEIPWLLSIWEARKQAAAEGKPILVWSGSGGAPVGSC